jgi:6-phosphofructokinase 1
VGACIAYTPESGITLDTLRDDCEFLKRRYALDEKGKAEGRLVIKFVLSAALLAALY